MRKGGLILMAACGLWSCTRPASVSGLRNESMALLEGGQQALGSLLGEKATIFFTLDPECPITQLYTHDFQRFADDHTAKGVSVVGVYTGAFMQHDEAGAFAQGAGLAFPQIMDNDCRLALALQARVTPECFIVAPDGRVVYRGALDDRPVREGRKKPMATKAYLAEALEAFLATGKPQQEVVAVGCIVECDD